MNDAEYNRVKSKYSNRKGYITWTILFILGYSSLFETYARYEIGKERIVITKFISKKNDMRAGYLNDETNPPPITISFVYTKLQTKSLERKQQRGEIDRADYDIPLIVVK